MLQILLAADEKLQKAIVGPLEQRGCAVRVVRGLSEIAEACLLLPRPQIVAAALPVSAGGPQAISELKSSSKAALPPILVLLPPNRGAEAAAIRAAGAADVFESPLKLSVFLARARELAAPGVESVAEAPTSVGPPAAAEVAALSSGDLNQKPSEPSPAVTSSTLGALFDTEAPSPNGAPAYVGPPRWPVTVPSLADCQNATIAYNMGQAPEGFDKETLQALFRVMTDVEVRAVKDYAAATRKDGSNDVDGITRLFLRVTAERLRVRQAQKECDSLSANGAAPVDEPALQFWLKALDEIVTEMLPIQQRAVSAGDLQGIRQYNLVTDAVTRLRRDLENCSDRMFGRTASGTSAGGLMDESLPPPPGVSKQEVVKAIPKAQPGTRMLNVESVSASAMKEERLRKLAYVGIGVGAIGLVAFTLWVAGVFNASFEYPKGIPNVQFIEYHFSYTRAVVSNDFDVAKWGHALEVASKNTKRIELDAQKGHLATLDGDVAYMADGSQIKLDASIKPVVPPPRGISEKASEGEQQ
jgi:CheY-like chemotaxis protein